MNLLYVVGRAVANLYDHGNDRQFLKPEGNCLLQYVSVSQVLLAWVMQIFTVLTTIEQQRPLHLKHLRFSNTVPHLFCPSEKTPSRKGKLHGETKYVSVLSSLHKFVRKIAKRYHDLCIKHLMIPVLQVLLAADIIRGIVWQQVNPLVRSFVELNLACLVYTSKVFRVDATHRLPCL